MISSGSNGVNFFQVLTGLTVGTYQFRAVASNNVGIVFGTNQTLTVPLFGLVKNLRGIESGSVVWGDYDNDGRLDILLAGYVDGYTGVSDWWQNTGHGFTNGNALPGIQNSAVAWGDYDNDGRLDILLTGYSAGITAPGFQVWRNTGSRLTNVSDSVSPGLTAVSRSAVACENV